MTLLEAAVALFCRTGDPSCVAAVARNVPRIEDLAGAYGVSPPLAVAVCARVSRLGVVRARSLCGASRDPDTSVTATVDALSAAHHRCRSWAGALRVMRYRGRCNGADPRGYVPAVRAIERRLMCAMRTGRRC